MIKVIKNKNARVRIICSFIKEKILVGLIFVRVALSVRSNEAGADL